MIATQNPIELEGTYPLPEAQLDRFLMRVPMGYPSREAEVAILETQGAGARARSTQLEPVATAADVAAAADADRDGARRAGAPGATSSTSSTRPAATPTSCSASSPRGALALQRAARALAASVGRDYVIPDDVKRARAGGPRAPRAPRRPRPSCAASRASDVVRAVVASVPVPGAIGLSPVASNALPVAAVRPALTRRGWTLAGAAGGLVAREPRARRGTARRARDRRRRSCSRVALVVGADAPTRARA